MSLSLTKSLKTYTQFSIRYLSSKSESELLKTFSYSKSNKSSRQRSFKSNNINTVNNNNNNNKNNNTYNTKDHSAIIHLKRSIVSKDAIDYSKIKHYKQYIANLECSLCKRFEENSNIESILSEVIDLTNNGIYISKLSKEIIDRLDTFINLENLNHSSLLIRLLSGDTNSSSNSPFAFNFQLISKYPLNLQKLIILNIYVPLFENEKIIKIQHNISRKLSSDELFALISSIKLYNGELSLKDLSSIEIESIFNNIDSNEFKNKLLLNSLNDNINSYNIQDLARLMKCYLNYDDLFDFPKNASLLNVRVSLNIPKQFILKYLQLLKKNDKEKEFEILIQKLNLSIYYTDILSEIQNESKSFEYLINHQFNDQKIYLATAIKYFSNHFSSIDYFIRSSISKCQGYKIIDGKDFHRWINSLSDDEKSIVFNNLLRGSVITNYSELLNWLKYRSKHPLLINLVIYAGSKNSFWVERVFLMYDYELISKLCNSPYADLKYINEIKRHKSENPNFVDMIDLPISYDGEICDDLEDLYANILKQNKNLSHSNKEDNEKIFNLMIEIVKQPKMVMNLISKMYPSTKAIINDLIKYENDDKALKNSIYQRPTSKPLSIFNIIIKYWEHDSGYNIRKITKRYPEILASLTKIELEKLLKDAVAKNNYIILDVINKNKNLVNSIEVPQLNINLISKIDIESPLKYQRKLYRLSKLKATKVTHDQFESLFSKLPEKYQLIFLKYSTQLFKKVPFSKVVFSKILNYYWTNSKNCNQITSILGIKTKSDDKIKYNESIALKWDMPYLFIGLMFLLNKNNARLDQWNSILNKALILPKNVLDSNGFEILNCVNKLNKFDINLIKFRKNDIEYNFNKLLKLTIPMGLLFKNPLYLQNLTISFLIRFSYLIAISPEFPENIKIKDMLSLWYVLLNSNGQEEELLKNIGFWDLIASEERIKLLKNSKTLIPKFEFNKELFNYHDLNMLFRMLFYISKYRNLTTEELNYFVNMSKNIMNDTKLSLKEKSFPMYVGYVLVSKNSSILFRYHKDIIKSDSNFKVFKSIIPSILEATISTKVGDLDLVLDQMIRTYKNNRIEIDEEVNKFLKYLVLNDKNDLAQDLFLTYNKKCKYPKFKSDIGRSMGWKSFNEEVQYKAGEINTKVDGRNIKLFDEMIDEI